VSPINLYIMGARVQQRGYVPGGQSYLRRDGRIERGDHDCDPHTTIQRMRRTAAIKGLHVAPSSKCPCDYYCS